MPSHVDEDNPQCFIIMPFGKKPLPDGRTYDFDKVYRVIIARAVREAGMKPLRADETVGSRLIHSDMFKDLRDRPVVLADLSLENPNVFYELGVRHVMSPTGTVLMCRQGTELPFDVRLSRVIKYRYNGDELDWEEVEETVKSVKLALQDAQLKQPDSPVHVLLEQVIKAESTQLPPGTSAAEVAQDLEKYEQALATHWRQEGHSLPDLIKEHANTLFGVRALGHLCLLSESLPEGTAQVAGALSDAEQYPFAARIYEKLKGTVGLSNHDSLRFATAYSETHPDIPGAEVAIDLVRQVLADELSSSDETLNNNHLGQTYRRLGGLLQWKWQLTRDEKDLSAAIEALDEALVRMTKARMNGDFRHPSLIAQVRLKLVLALRVRDQTVARQDAEGHRDAILKLAEMPGDHRIGVSYLHWFQAFTLADLGAEDQAEAKALDQLSADRALATEPGGFEIGRRQYALLRRFLETSSDMLRNPRIMNRIGRHLLVGQHNRRT